MNIKDTLEDLINMFNDFKRRWNQLQFEISLALGSLDCNASLDQREKSKPFLKGVHAILQLEKIRNS